MKLRVYASHAHTVSIKAKKLAKKVLVAQVAPSVRVALGEPFAGKVNPQQMVTCLKKIGFDYVFDTFFSADLTIIEEGTELLGQLKKGAPMFTSCCPGWMQFIDQACPEIKQYVSTSKSPQQMMGAVVKTYFAEQIGVSPNDIYMVSFMPCVKKQGEANLAANDSHYGYKDVDLVITTSELAAMMKEEAMDPTEEGNTPFDNPMGEGTGSGAVFGRTGGVMLAALRFAYSKLTGGVLPDVDWHPMEGLPGVKEALIQIKTEEGYTVGLRVAVVVGLADAKKYVGLFKEGKVRHDFVEVMACYPAGCVTGGGQPPIGKDKGLVEKRRQAMNAFDDGKASDTNPWITKLYEEYLGEPMGEKAHELLHRHDASSKD